VTTDEFNPWHWDRGNGRTGQSRLTVERHGHEVSLDHRGVSLDGRRIVRDDPSRGGEHGFQLTEEGSVLYRGREVAAIAPPPPGTVNPGEVTIWPSGRPPADREEEERRRRDDRYRADQHRHEEPARGQERTL
jgi:hypothetical protein